MQSYRYPIGRKSWELIMEGIELGENPFLAEVNSNQADKTARFSEMVDEILERKFVSIERLRRMVDEGLIQDGLTLASLAVSELL